MPAAALGDVAEAVERARPGRIGLTGGGASELVRLLSKDALPVNEFACYQQLGECAVQDDGACGWTPTAELTACLDEVAATH